MSENRKHRISEVLSESGGSLEAMVKPIHPSEMRRPAEDRPRPAATARDRTVVVRLRGSRQDVAAALRGLARPGVRLDAGPGDWEGLELPD